MAEHASSTDLIIQQMNLSPDGPVLLI